MQRQRKPRGKWDRLLLFVIAMSVLFGGYYWGNQNRPVPDRADRFHSTVKPQAMSPFLLTDHRGEPFTHASLKDHWNLVFFGYSRGDETKVMLSLASRIYNRLAIDPELQRSFRAVLISVDPERDSPEVLEAFVSHYNQAFTALTGSLDEIDIVAEQLGATYRIRSDRRSTDYLIDHSSSMALIDPKGELLGLFTGVVDAAGIAQNIKSLSEAR